MNLLFSLCGLLLHLSAKFVVGGSFNGVDYRIAVQNDDIISPCDESPNNFVDKLYDLSNINITYENDESLLIQGTAKYIANETINGKIILDTQVFKKQRGQWMSTVYNFYRHDVCASIWNPAEIWYKFTVNVPEERRTCPPHIGTIYNLDFEAGLTMKNIQDRHAAGDYMTRVTVIYGPMPDDFLCFTVLGYIEKI